MNTNPDTQLDAFETALLADLQHQITQGQAADDSRLAEVASIRPTRRAPQPRRRLLLAGAVAAAGALAVGVGVQVAQPQPAFAITGKNGEDITVRVMRLEGAKALEQALSDRGINADISYLPFGKTCASGRFTPAKGAEFLLRDATDWFEVLIPANSMGKADTFVLAASVKKGEKEVETRIDADIARGPVAPCRIVDAT